MAYAGNFTVLLPTGEKILEDVNGLTQPGRLVADDASYVLRLDGPSDFVHQFTASGGLAPLWWHDLTFYGGPSGPGDAAMSSAGLFTWDRSGALPGYYFWEAQVWGGRLGDIDTATLTILIVPEPATAALAGLAALGLVGLVRRPRG